ncbi:transposase family protein [Actinomadura sp. K4S16]|uniref:transposase family protein n=1 Tax=Actinomadura sp. K4S16 TaxID=1316147 RepID=UPI0011F06DFB|nr:transposase family protein [Actinomadura sp. K4S16]
MPLNPEAVAFAGHYDFTIDVLAAYRPTGKGCVERQVTIVRDHVVAGGSFSCLDELDKVPDVGAAAAPHRPPHPRCGDRGPSPRDHAALRLAPVHW